MPRPPAAVRGRRRGPPIGAAGVVTAPVDRATAARPMSGDGWGKGGSEVGENGAARLRGARTSPPGRPAAREETRAHRGRDGRSRREAEERSPPAARRGGRPRRAPAGRSPPREGWGARRDRGVRSGSRDEGHRDGADLGFPMVSKIEPLTVSLPTPTSRLLNTPPRIQLLPPPALEVSKNPPPSSESLPAKPSRVSAAVGPDQRVVAGGELRLEGAERRVVRVERPGQAEHAGEVGAGDGVVAGPAVERVVARAAEDGVIPAAGLDEVRPARVAERIAGLARPDQVGARRRRRCCRCPGRR